MRIVERQLKEANEEKTFTLLGKANATDALKLIEKTAFKVLSKKHRGVSEKDLKKYDDYKDLVQMYQKYYEKGILSVF